MAKPTLKDFEQHCCDCKFMHPLPDDKKRVGGYVNPPVFSHYDEDVAVSIPCSETALTRHICRHFVSKGMN